MSAQTLDEFTSRRVTRRPGTRDAQTLDELDARLDATTTDDERVAILDAAGRSLRTLYAARDAYRRLIHGDPQYRYDAVADFINAMTAATNDDLKIAVLAQSSPTLRGAFVSNQWWTRPDLTQTECERLYLRFVKAEHSFRNGSF
jgi:hypothetical protein